MFFDRLDVNGDDFLTPDEIPERMRPFLQATGIQIGDKMSRAEFTKLYDEMRKKFQPKKEPDPKKEPEPKKEK